MKKVIRAAQERRKFIIDKNEVQFSAKAIRRKDSHAAVVHSWFPLSQVDYREFGSFDIEVSIPEWLYQQKVGDNFTIGN